MRGFKFACLSFTAILGAAGVTSSCNGPSDDCETHRSCSGGSSTSGSSGDAGEGNAGTSGTSGGKGGAGSSGSGSGGSAGIGAGTGGEGGLGGNGNCDATKSPTEESCLVTDEFAVFVAPDGDDEADGSQAAPLATLTKAVEVAAGDKLVLVCSGTFDEHVVLAAGARIYGGFKCADWTADTEKPLIKPTTSGPALKIDGVDDEVLIEHVSFEVGDAVGAGETSLAAIVNLSPSVTLRAVSLKAGKGNAGANGTLADFTFPNESTFKGNAEVDGGASKKCNCQSTLSSTGGVGGTPVDGGQNGSKGQPDHGGGLGGDPTAGDCGVGVGGKSGTGSKGANAPAAGPADGAKILGSASSSGWLSTAGVDGTTGAPGQGGGGGASFNSSGHGGGGGCGGCGGNGGTAGKGGGGSIALLALSSPVLLESSALVTADAGNGGNGAAGQIGQKKAGGGGAPLDTQNSCGGGSGGFGGDGGAGGGGAGGISVGVLWKGAMAPTVTVDTTITNGKAGTSGIGGVPGTNNGIAGVTQKVLSLN